MHRLTTSVGRLFDAVSAIAGIAQQSRFEGQAAMLLERAIDGLDTADCYPLPDGDWAPLIAALAPGRRRRRPPQLIAARFHNALARRILAVAQRSGLPPDRAQRRRIFRTAIWPSAPRRCSNSAAAASTRTNASHPTTAESPSVKPCWQEVNHVSGRSR